MSIVDTSKETLPPTPSEQQWYNLFVSIHAQLKRVADSVDRPYINTGPR